jgi:hypothetical protein
MNLDCAIPQLNQKCIARERVTHYYRGSIGAMPCRPVLHQPFLGILTAEQISDRPAFLAVSLNNNQVTYSPANADDPVLFRYVLSLTSIPKDC